MIQYKDFDYAAAPRTGSTWFQHACSISRLDAIDGNTFTVHAPFPAKQANRFTVTTVRHPADWLASYYVALEGGSVQSVADELVGIARESNNVDRFFDRVINEKPGAVSRVFSHYAADSAMRVEDMPWCFLIFIEPFKALTRYQEELIKRLPKVNATKHLPQVPSKLRRRLVVVEEEYCDQFEYL